MTGARRYRSHGGANKVVALSMSYQRENLLARGLGLEHLREMLIRLARPLLRQEVSLAYGGNWKETEDNFTYELLRLISAEQADDLAVAPAPTAAARGEENVGRVSGTGTCLGRLINHSSWPTYLSITPGIEARWINCCRIVRVTQAAAGLPEQDWAPDAEVERRTDRVVFNTAVGLSAMRRLSMEPITLRFPEVPVPEVIPPASARVVLGGKVDGYTGFVPGIFEEALLTLEAGRPLYLLGGFGGAAEVLARTILGGGSEPPPELTESWHRERTPDLGRLLPLCGQEHFRLPAGVRATGEALSALFERLREARGGVAASLRTGLTDEETRELLMTRDMARAVRLIRQGLTRTISLDDLPA